MTTVLSCAATFRGVRRFCFFVCLGALALPAAGCGGSVDKLGRLALSGSVTLDGAPLPSGTIRFEPFGAQPNKTTTSGAVIKDGAYAIPASAGLPPGKYTASIDSHGAEAANTGSTDPQAAMDAAAKTKPPEQIIPAKYNKQTELVVDVTKSGPNKFDFPLESKKK